MAHIWFCPTSVVTMVSSSMSLLISCMTFWGAMGVQHLSSLQTCDLLTWSACSVQSGQLIGDVPIAQISALSAFLASACKLTHLCLCLLNSVASMSIWMTLPVGSFMRSWGL